MRNAGPSSPAWAVQSVQEQLRARNQDAAVLLALHGATGDLKEKGKLWAAWESNDTQRKELEKQLTACEYI